MGYRKIIESESGLKYESEINEGIQGRFKRISSDDREILCEGSQCKRL